MYQGHRIQSEGPVSHQSNIPTSMVQAIGQLAATSPRETTHCEKAILSISKNMEGLEVDIQSLEGAINPILMPPIPGPEGQASTAPLAMSNIAETLFRFNSQLEGARNWIQQIRQRIDL